VKKNSSGNTGADLELHLS